MGEKPKKNTVHEEKMELGLRSIDSCALFLFLNAE